MQRRLWLGILAGFLLAAVRVSWGQGAPSAVLVATFSGTRSAETTAFTVTGAWELRWSAEGAGIEVSLLAEGHAPEPLVGRGEPAQGVVHRGEGGVFRLRIEADAAWKIAVYGSAAPEPTAPPSAATAPEPPAPKGPASPADAAGGDPDDIAKSAPAPGDPVTIETDSETITGTLLDKLPAGYLVRTAGGTRVIPYETVQSIAKAAGPGAQQESLPPPPAPPPRQTPPLRRKDKTAGQDQASAASTAWPAQVSLGYVTGLSPRRRSTALGRQNPDGSNTAGSLEPDSALALLVSTDVSLLRWLAIGLDFVVDTTTTALVGAGQQGCSLWLAAETGNNCLPFEDPVYYDSLTLQGTLWVKPYYRLGPVRLWGGAGLNAASVTATYEPAPFGGLAYGSSGSAAFSISLGGGADAKIPIADRVQLIVSASLALGAPVYSERFDDLFVQGATWESGSAGHAVNATRLNLGFGIAFPPRARGKRLGRGAGRPGPASSPQCPYLGPPGHKRLAGRAACP